MAFPQIGPASISVGLPVAGLARTTLLRRSQRLSHHHLSQAATRRAHSTHRYGRQQQRLFGQRSFSQQSHRPKADSKVNDSKIRWYPIPVGLGVGFLALVQFYKVYSREKEPQENGEPEKKPKKRPRVRPDGPWYDISLQIHT